MKSIRGKGMKRVNTGKGFIALAVVLLITGGAVYLYESTEGGLIGWLVFGFLIFALLVYQYLVAEWLFFIIPAFLKLHPYPHVAVVIAGIPFYLKISVAIYLFANFLKGYSFNPFLSITKLSFAETFFMYVIALSVAYLVSKKFLRYEEKKTQKSEVTQEEHKKNEEENFWISLVNTLSSISERDFRSRIVGQDRAITQIIRSLKVATELLPSEEKRSRVLASMIFVGATGVGKTETAKVLAELLKPLGYQFIRIDLNQYRTPESAWTLIGSPRGYVGSEHGGTLTRALMKNPKAVILFDEMEKAHPELHTTFMTLLDEGYIEEQSTGRKVYLQAGIIIFTSNLYSDKIAHIAETVEDELELELQLRDFVERYFGRPEIVGRIDAIVPFRRLTPEDLEEIARRVLTPYGKAYLAHELTLELLDLAQRYGVRAFVRKLKEIAVTNPQDFIFKRKGKLEASDSEGIELFPDDLDIGGGRS